MIEFDFSQFITTVTTFSTCLAILVFVSFAMDKRTRGGRTDD